MTTSFVPGLLTGLSLIVAIGAQNAYVLRQGLRREHVGVVVAICALSDLVLILAGVARHRHDRRTGAGGARGDPLARSRVPDVVRPDVAAGAPARPDALHAATAAPAQPGAGSPVAPWPSPGSTRTSTSTPCCSSAASRPRTATRAGGGSPPARRSASLAVVRRARVRRPPAARRPLPPRAWQVLEVLIGLTMLVHRRQPRDCFNAGVTRSGSSRQARWAPHWAGPGPPGGARVVATVDGRSERTRRLAHGLELLPSLAEVVAASDLVVSVCPPAPPPRCWTASSPPPAPGPPLSRRPQRRLARAGRVLADRAATAGSALRRRLVSGGPPRPAATPSSTCPARGPPCSPGCRRRHPPPRGRRRAARAPPPR